jgi:hypothetical protein
VGCCRKRRERLSFVVICRSGTPAYMLQAKIKGKICVYTLTRVIAALELTFHLKEGSDAVICLRLWTLP